MIDERYAAGFFDGEGCIHIARNVRVIISGCFRPGLLDMFAARWGGKVLPAVWSNTKHRPGVRWEITGDKSHKFLQDVLPYLIEKKEQAFLGLKYRDLKRSFNVRGGKGYSEEQREQILNLEALVRQQKYMPHVYG